MQDNSDHNRMRSERVGEIVSISQRGRVWYVSFQHDGKQHRRSLRTRSKKEARLRALAIERDLVAGDYAPTSKPVSIESVVHEYDVAMVTAGRAAKTLAKYRLVSRRVLELAKQRRAKAMRDVDLRFLDAYRAECKGRGAMPRTIHNESVLIRQIVNFALTRKMIVDDPLAGLKFEKPKTRPQPCWTYFEMQQIEAKASGVQKDAFVLLTGSGMRIGELKNLEWNDVDFDRRMLYVREKDGWKPKSRNRVVPICNSAHEMLKRRSAADDRSPQYVFTAPPSRRYPHGGHPISERRLLQYLKRILKRLGLSGHLHTFRHSVITDALLRGIPEAVVREWVGHIDPEVIAVYTHINALASLAAMQRLDEARDKDLQQQDKEVPDDPQDQQGSVDNPAQNQHTEEKDSDDNSAN